jgi:NAD(P)-dependent dehydrogenase (short-subunit alcohol dehydrogenase family)
MTSSTRFAGQHILVTGAGTGIGRAIALRLAAEGASLSLLARNEAKLADTAEAARTAGARAVGVFAADIRHKGSVDRAIDAAAAQLGPLRAIVANSGVGGPNAPGPDDRFDDLVQTNLNGTYYCLRAAQRHLVPGPDTRHMVVTASILGRIGVAGYTGYCASKAGLLGLVRAMATELAKDNVQVNAICPGWVNTEMARQGIAGMAEAMGISYDEAYGIAMREVPLGRMSEPEDIAGMIAWLVSADSRGVTGQGLDVNGGAFMI